MFSFLETVFIENGQAQHLEYHQMRINDVFEDFYTNEPILQIDQLFSNLDLPNFGKYRARIIYENQWLKTEILPYQEKNIQRLKTVELGEYDYTYKWEDRSYFSEILIQNKEVDEVIFTQNGLIKDCTIGNLAFLKDSIWFTPKQPMLNGTTRRRLIDENKIQELDIFIQDLPSYSHICLINVFRPLSFEKSLLISESIL
ncbi:aminotransferase class IV [Aquirufa sp. ROCK2-A2]